MAEYDHGKASRVRELCRLLKPVIGNQARTIWLAYVAEDDNGKKQIEDYLELLSAKHFLGSIDSDNAKKGAKYCPFCSSFSC